MGDHGVDRSAYDNGRECPTIQSQARLVGLRGTWDRMQHDVSLEVPRIMIGGLVPAGDRLAVVAPAERAHCALKFFTR